MAERIVVNSPEVAGSLYEQIIAEKARRVEAKPETVRKFYADPLGFVMWAWRWGLPGPLEKFTGPDLWQKEFLIDLGEEVTKRNFDGRNAVSPIRMTVASGHGVGKALSKRTMLHTPNGLRRWGSLKVGEEVFAEDGTPTKVTGVFDQGQRLMFLVTLDDGSQVEVDGQHLWKVRGRNSRRTRSYDWETLTTEQILERGVQRSNGESTARQWELPCQGSVQFPYREVPIHPYTLGVWLGDGGRNSQVITSADHEVVSRLQEVGEKITKGVRYAWRVSMLLPRLRALGIADRYSYQKSVPAQYMENTPDIRAEVLRGLLDTDGECGMQGSVTFSSTSLALARDVVWLARSLGGKAQMQPTIKEPMYPNAEGISTQGRDCWRCTVTMPEGFRSFYIKRKQERVRPVQSRYLTRWIDKIEEVGYLPAMCITVAHSSKCFLANDFVVTHNSTLAAFITCWVMSTRPYAKGTVTANTFTQLETKTWATIEQWFKTSRTAKDFLISSNGIKNRVHQKDWMVTPQTCKEENSEAFAGQHAATSTSFYIFDESSSVPDKIFEVAEGGLITGSPLLVVMGNPTRSSGKFFRINFGDEQHRWNSRIVDSRECMMANKTQIQEWIEDYGEDSDFVRVRVKGLPPRAGDMQYIPSDSVYEAQKRICEVMADEPLIAGVDLARGGGDNAVVWFRRGDDARTIPPIIIEGKLVRDSTLLVAKLADMATQTYAGQKVHSWFLDGTGVGGPMVDRLIALGHKNMIEVQFGGQCPDPRHYANMRSWMWSKMRDWLGKRGAIPPKDRKLETDLTNQGLGQGAGNNIDRIVLESKESMKKRGLDSPDRADALCVVSGTLIETPRGPVPIEDIQPGDMVVTPFGLSPVEIKYRSFTDSITKVKFSNGSEVVGKGEHRVFTFSCGSKRLDALSLTDEVDILSRWRLGLWRVVSLSCMADRSFGFKQLVDTFKVGERVTRKDYFIAGFTRTISALFRKATTFTIRIQTGATMSLGILRPSLSFNTGESTCSSDYVTRLPWQEIRNTLSEPGSPRPSGMDLQRELSGTGSMGKKLGLIGFLSKQSAPSAGQNTGHTSLLDQGSVLARACSRLRSVLTSPIPGSVLTAARNLWLTAIGRQPVVPVSVQTESVLPTETYNLTLREHNAYYANGVLVFNCLTFAHPVNMPRQERKSSQDFMLTDYGNQQGWMGAIFLCLLPGAALFHVLHVISNSVI